MNLSDLAVRLRQLAAQWQVDGTYEPAHAAILTESDDGIVRFYPAMVAKLGPVIREARARGAFDLAHVAGIGLLIDGSASDGQLFGSLHQHLRSRGIHCWGIDARAGAIERLADVFDALASPQSPAGRDEEAVTVAAPATIPTSNLEAMSAESKQYLQELSASFSTNKAVMMLFVRWVTENPSLQGITPTDDWVNTLREWMLLPAGAGTIEGIRGEMERTKLRAKIRQSFPLLPLHYWMLATKADDAVRNIQDVRIPDPGKLADATATAFAEARWLDDPAMPDPPDNASLNRAQAMAAMTRLGNWLKSRAVQIERGSVPQQPAEQTISPANEAEKPECPFDPANPTPVVPDGRTVDAVRGVVADWDGKNWEAVRQVLRNIGRPLDEIEKMTLLAIRMAFTSGQQVMIRTIGGTLATATHSITRIEPPGTPAEPAAVPDGFYSPADLAKAIGSPGKAEAIRKLLGRMMKDNQLPDTAWLENNNPASGQAKILFKLSVVRPHLDRYVI